MGLRFIQEETNSPIRESFTLAGVFRVDVTNRRWVKGGALRADVTVYDKKSDELVIQVEQDLNTIGTRRALLEQLMAYRNSDDLQAELATSINGIYAQIVAEQLNLAKPQVLRDIPPADDDLIERIEGFPVLLKHPSIIFGNGGTGKSLIALWLSGQLGARGYNVLWCDWELDGGDHAKRFIELFDDDRSGNVHYLRCDASIGALADRIRTEVQRLDIDIVVVDSIAFAIDGSASDVDAARAFYQSLRAIGSVGSILIAHESRNTDGESPFGSVFWANGARLTWHIQNVDRTSTNKPMNGMCVSLVCKKDNLRAAKKGRVLKFQITSTESGTFIGRFDVSATERIEDVLRDNKNIELSELVELLPDESYELLKKTRQRFLESSGT